MGKELEPGLLVLGAVWGCVRAVLGSLLETLQHLHGGLLPKGAGQLVSRESRPRLLEVSCAAKGKGTATLTGHGEILTAPSRWQGLGVRDFLIGHNLMQLDSGERHHFSFRSITH